MKNLLLIGTVLIATSASAGVRIETITRDIKSGAVKGDPQLVEVQNGAVRAGSDQGGVLLKAGKITFLDDKRKTYTEMDKAKMEELAQKTNAAMSQMQEKMKNLTPEQRAQMEKMMGQKMPGAGPPSVFEAKNTGKTDTVEGRKCTTWHLLKDGEIMDEMCVVPFSSLPGKEDMQKSMKELAEAFSSFSKSVPDAAAQIKVRNSIDGYPVRTRPYFKGQPHGTESVLKSWTEANIPASTFEIPAGYTKKDLPSLGGR